MAFGESPSVADDEASTRTAVLNSSLMIDAFLTDGQSQCGTEGGPEASTCVSRSEVDKPQPRRDGRGGTKKLLAGTNNGSDEATRSVTSPDMLNGAGNPVTTSDVTSQCQTEKSVLVKKETQDGDGRVKKKKKKVVRRMVKLSALGVGGEESTACTSDTFDLPVPRIIYVFQKPKPKKRSTLQRLTNSMRLKLGFGSRRRLDPDHPEVHSKTLVDL